MTGTTNDDVRGAARTDSRQRRRRRRAALTLAAAVALMAGAPVIATAWPAASGIAAAPLLTALGILAIAAAALGFGWRDADEVLRGRALRVFAAVGVVTIVGNPIAEMLGAAFHMPAPVEGLWWLSVVAGAAVLVGQRWRDRATA